MVFFKDSEYKNKSKCDPKAIATLESLRSSLGIPMTLTADACLGGHSSDSWHYYDDATGKLGKAFDGTTNAPLWDFIFKAKEAGFTGIGVYVLNGVVKYFHLDIRDTAPTFWIGIINPLDINDIHYIYSIGGA